MENMINFSNDIYRVITLCGSLKFFDSFQRVQSYLERHGHVCFSVCHSKKIKEPTKVEKSIIDHVYLKKIMLSDCIIVIDRNGYVGESTTNEIQFAKLNNKPVIYCTDSIELKFFL